MRRKSVFIPVTVFVTAFLFSGVVQAQEKTVAKADSIHLLDTKKVPDYLGLSKSQKDSVLAKIAQIQKVVDEDKRVREEMMARFMAGQPGQFPREAMMAVRTERAERQKKIDALSGEIQSILNAKQKEKFKNVIVPNLMEMARAERERFRQMRRQ